jgi:hypothetical protein
VVVDRHRDRRLRTPGGSVACGQGSAGLHGAGDAASVGAWALALGALGLYVVLAPGFTFDRWIPPLVFAALFVTAVELLRRQIGREHSGAEAAVEP